MKRRHIGTSAFAVVLLSFMAGYLWPKLPPEVAVKMKAIAPHTEMARPNAVSVEAGPAPPIADSVGKISRILQTRDSRARRILEVELLQAISSGPGLAKMLVFLKDNRVSREAEELQSMIRARWGEIDPSAAMDAMSDLAPSRRETAENEVLSGWLEANPEMAWSWAIAHPASFMGPSQGDRLPARWRLYYIIEHMVKADMGGLVPGLASRVDDPGLGASLINVYVANWVKYDYASAKEWSGSLPDGPMRDAASWALKGVRE